VTDLAASTHFYACPLNIWPNEWTHHHTKFSPGIKDREVQGGVTKIIARHQTGLTATDHDHIRSISCRCCLWLKAKQAIRRSSVSPHFQWVMAESITVYCWHSESFGDNNSPNPTKARRTYAPSLPLDCPIL
jgi:hypothetical protein